MTRTTAASLVAGVATLLALAAMASGTYVEPAPPGVYTAVAAPGGGPTAELPLLAPNGILDTLYGLENLERVPDAGSHADEIWWLPESAGQAEVRLRAKFAGFQHSFGVLPGESGWNFTPLIDSGKASANKLYSGNASWSKATFDVEGPFRFGLRLLDCPAYLWSSAAADNTLMPSGQPGDGLDHLVTWRITGNAGYPGNRVGNYVLAWEDLDRYGRTRYACDADFNDVVFEVGGVHVPEPTSLVLLMLGAVLLRSRRRGP